MSVADTTQSSILDAQNGDIDDGRFASTDYTLNMAQEQHVATQQEEVDGQAGFDAAVKEGAARGAIVGLALGVGSVMLATRWSPAFKASPLPFKVFLTTSITTAGLIIGGERATFSTPTSRHYYHSVLVEDTHRKHNAELQSASTWSSIRQRLVENRYTITGAIWTASMGSAFFLLYRKKHMNIGQKIVEARMYAQAAVLISLFATAGLASLGPSKSRHDHFNNMQMTKAHAYTWEKTEQDKLKVVDK